jgi:hypothetical protein
MSLEQQLYTSLKTNGQDITFDKLSEIITEVALQQWIELLQQPEYRFFRGNNFWLDSQRFLREGLRMLRKSSSELVDLRDQARVEAQIKEWYALVNFADSMTISAIVKREISTLQSQGTLASNKASSVRSLSQIDHDRAAQESVNRVTYIGGIFAPLAVIAGIFSMGGDFSPGQKKFFIYWTIAIPATLIIVAIIYADSIRKLTIRQFAIQTGKSFVLVSDTSELEVKPYPSLRLRQKDEDEELGWLRALGTIVGYDPTGSSRSRGCICIP